MRATFAPSIDTIPPILEPQLCTLVAHAPMGAGWLHEIKYDGWRLLARKAGSSARLFTRGGAEWSRRLPALTAAIRDLEVGNAWLDGEVLHLDDAGFPDFEALQRDMRTGDERGLVYHVWDIPWLNGADLTSRPLLERKEHLRNVVPVATPRFRYTDHVCGNGPEVFVQADALDLEGIVSKRIDSSYRPGMRTRDWQKVKAWRTHTVVIGGVRFDDKGRLESLLVGTRSNGALRYEGTVDFGLNRLGALRARLGDLGTTESPFDGEWKRSPRRVWLRPVTSIEIRALPRRPGRRLRHATFVRAV